MSVTNSKQVIFALSLGWLLIFALPVHAISFDSSTNAIVRNNDTLSWRHSVGPGVNRKFFVGVGIEENAGSGDEIVASVTFGGIALTRVGVVSVTSSGITERVEVWYLDEADIPSGNRWVRVRTTGNVREISAGGISLLNAEQGVPAYQTNSNTGPNAIATSISTTADNSWVLDVVGSGNRGTFTPGPGQTERWDTEQSGNNWTSSSAASTKVVINAGTNTMTQSQNANRLAHMVLAIRPDTAGPPAPVSPLAEWRMDETSWDGSGQVIDSSINGLTGTRMGNATPVPARVCNGASLNGSTDYIQVADTPLLDISNELTITTWIRPDVIPGSGLKTIISKDENYEFHINAAGEIYWWWNNAGGATRSFTTSGANLVAGNWYHVAISYSQSQGSQKIFVNGIERGSRAYAEALITNADPLQIGADQGYAGREFAGLIDEVRVYSSALDSTQINTIMNETRPCGTTGICASDYTVYAYGNLDISGTVTVNGNTVPNYDGTTNDGIDPATGTLVDVDPAPLLPALVPGSFPGSGSNQDLFNPATVAAGSYDDIIVTSTTTFSGGTYYIDRLVVRNGDTIILAPGDYFINRLNMSPNSNLIINPAGAVNIYINTELTTGNNVDLNAGGNAANLTINLYGGAEFELDNNGTLAGVVYSPFASSQIDFDAGVSITGAAITNGEVDIDNNTIITYGANEQAAAASVVQCTGGLDHLEIEHDGVAINCQAESITIRACANVDCSSLYTSDVTVDLTPGGWIGGNQVTVINGSTDFNLQILTAGTYTLGASNPSPVASQTPAYSCINTGPNPSGDACNIEFFSSALIYDVTTQTSCATSAAVSIQALATDPATSQCVPLFTGNKPLKAWTTYLDPVAGDMIGTPAVALTNNITPTPATIDLPVSGSAPAADNINLDFDATGTADFTVAYPDAGRLQLNLQYDGSGAETGLQLVGNDDFVIMPHHLNVYSDNANADCVSNDGSCSAFRRAGNTPDPLNEFELKIDAVCEDQSITPNFRLANIAISANLVAPIGGNNANISVGSFNMIKADNGQHTINNQTVSEVGVFSFSATPPLNGYFGETVPPVTSASIGRFYPAYFDTAATNACGSFSYSGQPFVVDIIAYNSNDLLTANYRDSFVQGPVVSDAGDNANFTNNIFNQGHFTAGAGQRTDVTYTYPIKDTPESTLNIRAIDSDAVTSQSHTEGSILIRSGRAVLDNAYGPETFPLLLPLRFEYYSAAGAGGYLINTDDSCSTYSASGADTHFANFSQNLNAAEVTSSGNGQAIAGIYDSVTPNPVLLHSPGDTTQGPGTGNYGSVNFVLNNISDWLKYNWNYDCDNLDADNDITTGVDAGLCGPYANASFGLYRGDDRIIYHREVLP